jgi:mannose-binding lectin
MSILYAQTSGTHQTNSGQFVPIPGLSLTLPEGVGVTALAILNLPNPYARGNDFPGGTLGISVAGTISPV